MAIARAGCRVVTDCIPSGIDPVGMARHRVTWVGRDRGDDTVPMRGIGT